MADQKQFLNVVSVAEAQAKIDARLTDYQPGVETIPVAQALGRVLASDVVSQVNVPNFDRSNFDGFAIRSADVVHASEVHRVTLDLAPDSVAAGELHEMELAPNSAISVATGAMIPRGADSILMVENTTVQDTKVQVEQSVAPGFGVAFAGSDIARSQVVLFGGQRLTSRETGILASIGMDRVNVIRRPRVAVISTGDELIRPGADSEVGKVYDSNARIIADAVSECGGDASEYGIAIDNRDELEARLESALAECDLVILTGGTSKGEGDLSYRILERLDPPGVLVHGVAIKPGKPVCLAMHGKQPVAVLPGFPTSAIFTFHQFVAPMIRKMAGQSRSKEATVDAKLAHPVRSAIGRKEYNLVTLSHSLAPNQGPELVAFPIGKGSGSVTTFSQADGFFSVGENVERVESEQSVAIQLLNHQIEVCDFQFIGSHCIGMDFLMSQLMAQGIRSKAFFVGSTSGLNSIRQFHGHVAGIHLLDSESGEYNLPYLCDSLRLVRGYRRTQGLIVRKDDSRVPDSIANEEMGHWISENPQRMMVNRNIGSGTRILIDRLLSNQKPPGFANCVNNHHASVAAVAQGRADWGVAIEAAAGKVDNVRFIPLADECYDFVYHRQLEGHQSIAKFLELLQDKEIREQLERLGCYEWKAHD